MPKSHPKGDASKNHFYTDLSIDNVDSALDIGIISQNVMCDNAFATKAKIAIQLAGADNCIISNSHLEQTQQSSETEAFIYAEEACNCWLQNSYVYYTGRHRATTSQPQASYIEKMFDGKKHRRMFIGEEFKTPNHWFKFTGCEFHSSKQNQYYFSAAYDISNTVFHEYWDNCNLIYSAPKDFFRFKCINTIPAGVTIRNSCLKYDTSDTDIGSPFRFHCGEGNCNCINEDTCPKEQLGKRFPFVHYENNVLDKFLENNPTSSWNYHVNVYEGTEHYFTISEAVNISGSYVSNVYRLNNGKFSKMSNQM